MAICSMFQTFIKNENMKSGFCSWVSLGDFPEHFWTFFKCSKMHTGIRVMLNTSVNLGNKIIPYV